MAWSWDSKIISRGFFKKKKEEGFLDINEAQERLDSSEKDYLLADLNYLKTSVVDPDRKIKYKKFCRARNALKDDLEKMNRGLLLKTDDQVWSVRLKESIEVKDKIIILVKDEQIINEIAQDYADANKYAQEIEGEVVKFKSQKSDIEARRIITAKNKLKKCLSNNKSAHRIFKKIDPLLTIISQKELSIEILRENIRKLGEDHNRSEGGNKNIFQEKIEESRKQIEMLFKSRAFSVKLLEKNVKSFKKKMPIYSKDIQEAVNKFQIDRITMGIAIHDSMEVEENLRQIQSGLLKLRALSQIVDKKNDVTPENLNSKDIIDREIDEVGEIIVTLEQNERKNDLEYIAKTLTKIAVKLNAVNYTGKHLSDDIKREFQSKFDQFDQRISSLKLKESIVDAKFQELQGANSDKFQNCLNDLYAFKQALILKKIDIINGNKGDVHKIKELNFCIEVQTQLGKRIAAKIKKEKDDSDKKEGDIVNDDTSKKLNIKLEKFRKKDTDNTKKFVEMSNLVDSYYTNKKINKDNNFESKISELLQGKKASDVSGDENTAVDISGEIQGFMDDLKGCYDDFFKVEKELNNYKGVKETYNLKGYDFKLVNNNEIGKETKLLFKNAGLKLYKPLNADKSSLNLKAGEESKHNISLTKIAQNSVENDDIKVAVKGFVKKALKDANNKLDPSFQLEKGQMAVIILIAIKNGGISTKMEGVTNDLAEIFRYEQDDSRLGLLSKAASQFSRLFQEEIKDKIQTGNPNAKRIVGLRLTRLTPEDALDVAGREGVPLLEKAWQKLDLKKSYGELSSTNINKSSNKAGPEVTKPLPKKGNFESLMKYFKGNNNSPGKSPSPKTSRSLDTDEQLKNPLSAISL